MTTEDRNDDAIDRAFTPALRWISNMMCLWSFCRTAACGRARQCKRDPRFCLSRYAPLVPDAVCDGVARMIEGKQRRVSYEDLRAHAPADIAAVDDWIARVEESRR